MCVTFSKIDIQQGNVNTVFENIEEMFFFQVQWWHCGCVQKESLSIYIEIFTEEMV